MGGQFSTHPCTPGEAPRSSSAGRSLSRQAKKKKKRWSGSAPHRHVDAHCHPADRHQRLQDGKAVRVHGAAALTFTLRGLCMTILSDKTHHHASPATITIVVFTTVRHVAELRVRTLIGRPIRSALPSFHRALVLVLGLELWPVGVCPFVLHHFVHHHCDSLPPRRTALPVWGGRFPCQGGSNIFNSLLCDPAECCCTAAIFSTAKAPSS